MTTPENCPKCGALLASGNSPSSCAACLLEAAALDAASPEQDSQYSFRDRKFGDYKLERQLGSGGMGVVYEATQISLHRRVALKFIRDSQIASPRVLRRFILEAEAAARLHHPNIVRIHEIGEVEGQPFFSMDLIEGESLRECQAKGRLLLGKGDTSKSSVRDQQVRIARLLARTARAVHHAHERGVLHRDLKPANIVVDAQGEPHLTDFGLAKILRTGSDGSNGTTLTATGDIGGTPPYMSPEQVSGSLTTVCSDVYGLGAILYELLTGRPPFHGPTPLEVMRQVLEQPPKRPRACNRLVHKDLDTICIKCLEKDPRFRYGSAAALAADLENWIERKPIKARPASPMRVATQWIQRNPIGAVLIALLLLGLVASLEVVKVLQRQKAELDLRDSEKFRTITSDIARRWRDTNTAEMVIESKDLAVLAGMPPVYDPVGPRLSFGMSIYGDAVYFAQGMAKIITTWERMISQQHGSPVYVDFKLIKHGGVSDAEWLAAGRADIMLVDPSAFLRAQEQQAGVELLAVEEGPQKGVLAAGTWTGITNFADLKGKRVMFCSPSDSLTLHTKALLFDAGITARQLAWVSNLVGELEYNYTSQVVHKVPKGLRRETMHLIFKRDADAGVTSERRFEMEKHRGLHSLGSVQCTPNVFAARANLDPAMKRHFQHALLMRYYPQSTSWHHQVRERRPDAPFVAAVAADAGFMNAFKKVLHKAEQFDSAQE